MAYVILFFAVFFLSTSAIFVKIAAAPAGITAFYRLLITTLALIPFLILKEENRREIGKLNVKQWGMGVLSGFLLSVQIGKLNVKQWGMGVLSGFLLSVHYVLWFESLNYTSVASSTVIVCLQPLFALIGGYFIFKEKYSKLALMGCVIAILGSVVIGWGDLQISNEALLGDIMALVAAAIIAGYFSKLALMGCVIAILGSVVIGWGDLQISNEALLGDIMALVAAAIIAGYFMVGQHIRTTLSAIPYSVISFGSGSVFLAIYSLMRNENFIDYPLKTWGAFLGLAFMATILGQFIFTWLLKWLSASIISMSILGEAVGTCILSYFILSEKISLQQGTGISMSILGEAVGTCILSYFILSEKISLQQGTGIVIILVGLGIFLSQSSKRK